MKFFLRLCYEKRVKLYILLLLLVTSSFALSVPGQIIVTAITQSRDSERGTSIISIFVRNIAAVRSMSPKIFYITSPRSAKAPLPKATVQYRLTVAGSPDTGRCEGYGKEHSGTSLRQITQKGTAITTKQRRGWRTLESFERFVSHQMAQPSIHQKFGCLTFDPQPLFRVSQRIYFLAN